MVREDIKPIPTEIAFGDPEAHEKAALNMSVYPYCTKQDLHCPHIELCGRPGWICPIEADLLTEHQANKGIVNEL